MSSQAPFTAALARRTQRVDQNDIHPTVKQEQNTDQDRPIQGASLYKARGSHAQDAIELLDSDSDTPRKKSQKIDPNQVVDLDSPSSVSNAVDIADDETEKQYVSIVESSKQKNKGRITDVGPKESFTKPPEVPDTPPTSDMMSKDDSSSGPRLDAHDKQSEIGLDEKAEITLEPRVAAERDTTHDVGQGTISMLGDHDLPRGENGKFQGKPITQECDDQAAEGPTYSTPVANMGSGHWVTDGTREGPITQDSGDQAVEGSRYTTPVANIVSGPSVKAGMSEGTRAICKDNALTHGTNEEPQNTFINHRWDQAIEEPMYKAPVAFMGPRISSENGSSSGQPFVVDPIQDDALIASARDAGFKVDTKSLEAASQEKIQNAQETLLEMGRLMRETKRKRELETLLRTSIEQNIAGRKPQNTVGAGQKVIYVNDPRVLPGAHPAMGDAGPSGLQIGLASLGVGNPDILRRVASNKQETIPPELGTTDGKEAFEPSMGFSSTGVRAQEYAGRMSAADLFVRHPAGPSLSGKQKVPFSERNPPMQVSETTASQASPSTTKSGTTNKRIMSCDLPTCIGECSEAERMLLYMKEVENKPWVDIRSTWKLMTGQVIAPSTLHSRYKRIKANLMEPEEGNVSIATSSKVENLAARSTDGASRTSRKRPHGESSIAEYFERHGQRVKALKARADPKNHRHEETFDGHEESLFLNSDSDDNYQASMHPKTGGKGLSMETMKKWKADAQVYPTPSQSGMEAEGLDFPKILYEYHVSRRIQLEGQNENQARTTASGPYYTVAEANAVAATKARQPNDADAIAVFRPGAWSYSYDKDDAGMETHRASGKGGTIHAWVTREIASPDENIGIPLTAFTTPSWMYIAMCSSSKHYATDDAHVTDRNEVIIPHARSSTNTIIKACTLLDLANRAASHEWIKLQAANIPNDGLGHIARAEMGMHMRQDLEKMDEENVAFDRTYRDPASGLETHIWVEMVEVEGPRN